MDRTDSDITFFIQTYRDRINKQIENEDGDAITPFVSFAEKKHDVVIPPWIEDNTQRFIQDTPNKELAKQFYLSECGYILCMVYSADGMQLVLGFSTGLIQLRNGITGSLLCTLRSIQFPPKPVYALQYSPFEHNVCYAACMDGAVYRIEIPNIETSVTDLPGVAIRADPLLETLNSQFYGSPSKPGYALPIFAQRTPALSLGMLSENKKMVVGYGDTSVKVYDMETLESETTYKVHKSRLMFIPKKLQRMHFGQVVALRAHPEKPYMFATGSWDKTLRIWDVRCKVGCIMTFEGVDICGDSIDLLREQCVCGSWQATEALTVWDLNNRKKLNIIRVQNRRADVDGEFIYACRYWRSADYNRKGKYAIIGGSGTNCVEVINLHNRYISCSYPARGSVLTVTSYQERIAFGGTYPVLCIVSFHDPKHERELYGAEETPDYTEYCLTYLADDPRCTPNDTITSKSSSKTTVPTPKSEFNVPTPKSAASMTGTKTGAK